MIMEDEKGMDEKILCVLAKDPHYQVLFKIDDD